MKNQINSKSNYQIDDGRLIKFECSVLNRMVKLTSQLSPACRQAGRKF